MNFIKKGSIEYKNDNKTISIKSYNVLAQCFCDGYWENNEWVERKVEGYLTWESRKKLILQDLLLESSDFLVLQEVEPNKYSSFYEKELTKYNYQGFMPKRKQYGNAIFFKKDKFDLIWHRDGSRILLVEFQNKTNKDLKIFIANCHLEGNPYAYQVRFNQIKSMFKHINKRKRAEKIEDDNFNFFVCGDFNESEKKGIYKLLSEGKLEKEFKNENESDEEDKNFYNSKEYNCIKMKSIYYEVLKKENDYTCITGGSNYYLCIDFIFYYSKKLKLKYVSDIFLDDENKNNVKMIPNQFYGSDHFSIWGQFELQ